MWVRFKEDFDFSPAAPKGFVTIAYKAGMVKNVTTECAEAAFAAEKAERTTRAKADEDTAPQEA